MRSSMSAPRRRSPGSTRFSPASWSRMKVRRSAGSAIPTGRAANIIDTLLLKVPSPLAAPSSREPRTDTGISVRTVRSSTDSPLDSSSSRNPFVIAASTTSLTVPPSVLRTALTSDKGAAAQATTRCEPTGPVRPVSLLVFTLPESDRTPTTTSVTVRIARAGVRSALRTARNCSAVSVASDRVRIAG